MPSYSSIQHLIVVGEDGAAEQFRRDVLHAGSSFRPSNALVFGPSYLHTLFKHSESCWEPKVPTAHKITRFFAGIAFHRTKLDHVQAMQSSCEMLEIEINVILHTWIPWYRNDPCSRGPLFNNCNLLLQHVQAKLLYFSLLIRLSRKKKVTGKSA